VAYVRPSGRVDEVTHEIVTGREVDRVQVHDREVGVRALFDASAVESGLSVVRVVTTAATDRTVNAIMNTTM